jgi:hypothetical protein
VPGGQYGQGQGQVQYYQGQPQQIVQTGEGVSHLSGLHPPPQLTPGFTPAESIGTTALTNPNVTNPPQTNTPTQATQATFTPTHIFNNFNNIPLHLRDVRNNSNVRNSNTNLQGQLSEGRPQSANINLQQALNRQPQLVHHNSENFQQRQNEYMQRLQLAAEGGQQMQAQNLQRTEQQSLGQQVNDRAVSVHEESLNISRQSLGEDYPGLAPIN